MWTLKYTDQVVKKNNIPIHASNYYYYNSPQAYNTPVRKSDYTCLSKLLNQSREADHRKKTNMNKPKKKD